MAIKINFDTAHNPEEPTLILAKKNGDKIGKINAYEIEVVGSLNDASEISFTVYKYVDGVKDYLWDEIVNFRLAYCVEWDKWFEIKVELDESSETKKTVSCTCLGHAELSQIMLYNIQINTEDDIARDEYVVPTVLYRKNGNLTAEEQIMASNILKKDVYYLDDYKSASLLHRITEKCPHYSIVHVDETIASIQRTFEFNETSIYDAFQDIANEINCLFVLDSDSDENGNIRRTIAVYDLESNCIDCGHRDEFTMICPKCGSKNINEGYGDDTGIFVSSDELAESIQLSVDTDQVKNCFKLEAGDDLVTATVRNCNPNGSDYIWHITDATKKDMSKELVDKIAEYDKEYARYYNEVDYYPELNADAIINYNDLVDKYNDFYEKYNLVENDKLGESNRLSTVPSSIVGYKNLMNIYYDTIDFKLYLESSMMPSPRLSDTSAEQEAAKLTSNSLQGVATGSLKGLSKLTADSLVLSMAKVIIDYRYKIEIKSSELDDEKYEWSGTLTVINYSDEEDKADSAHITIQITENVKEYTKQKLDKALAKGDNEDVSISGLFKKSFKNSKAVEEMEIAKELLNDITDEQVKKLCLSNINKKEELFASIEAGNITSTFGNINMDKREVIVWTDANKEKYATALKSWQEGDGEESTWYSTVDSDCYDAVYGRDNLFGKALNNVGVRIAFSPIVVNANGKVTEILSKQSLTTYIEKVVSDAYTKDRAFNQGTILSLDTKKIIARTDVTVDSSGTGFDNTAVTVAILLNFVGKYGDIRYAPVFKNSEIAKEMEKARNIFHGITDAQVKKLGYTDINTVEQFYSAIENADINPIFGNINMDKREVVTWTETNKEKYKEQLESWQEGENESDTWYSGVDSGCYDTVHGGSELFGEDIDNTGVYIAYSPMVVDSNGKLVEILSYKDLSMYIEGIVKEAYTRDRSFKQSTILSLDTKKIIACADTSTDYGESGFGNTAITKSRLMHFAGKYGAIQQAPNYSGDSEFELALKMYSFKRLESFNNAAQTCIDIMTQQGIPDKKTWSTNKENENLYDDLYIVYYKKQAMIQAEMNLRSSEIQIISGKDINGNVKTKGLMEYIEDIKSDVQGKLNFEKSLGEDLWREMCSFRREDKYSNSNYTSDGLNNAQLIKRANEFIEEANKDIYKSAEQQHSISADLNNLLVIEKFKPLVKSFKVGNFIRVMVDDELYKLRLIEYTIDYDDIEQISVDFSDAVSVASTMKTVKDVLDQASSMATSYDSVKRQAEKGSSSNAQLSDWVNKGMSLTNMKIVGSAENQDITWDSHGILCKEYMPESDDYNNKQLKIINRGLYTTTDNWETTKAGIGNFIYYDPRDGQEKEGYGVIADTLVSNLILSEDVGIYNKNNSITLNKDGFVISTKATGTTGANDKVFTIQKEYVDSNNKKQTTNLMHVDNTGNLVLNGSLKVENTTLSGLGTTATDYLTYENGVLKVGATNSGYTAIDNNGVSIHNSAGTTLAGFKNTEAVIGKVVVNNTSYYNTQITNSAINFRLGTSMLTKVDSSGMKIYSGGSVVGSFGSSSITLGGSNTTSITMAGNATLNVSSLRIGNDAPITSRDDLKGDKGEDVSSQYLDYRYYGDYAGLNVVTTSGVTGLHANIANDSFGIMNNTSRLATIDSSGLVLGNGMQFIETGVEGVFFVSTTVPVSYTFPKGEQYVKISLTAKDMRNKARGNGVALSDYWRPMSIVALFTSNYKIAKIAGFNLNPSATGSSTGLTINLTRNGSSNTDKVTGTLKYQILWIKGSYASVSSDTNDDDIGTGGDTGGGTSGSDSGMPALYGYVDGTTLYIYD